MASVLLGISRQIPESMLWIRQALNKKVIKKGGGETKVRQEFDVKRVIKYLRTKIQLPESDEVNVRQFSHGQSNPTYILRWPNRSLVVRKQPSGSLLRGAHDVTREYRLATLLRPLDVPAPNALVLCEDTDIIDTKFWCYDYVEGRHFKDAYLGETNNLSDREAIYISAAKCAATLHSAKLETTALQYALGRGPDEPLKLGNYLARQVRTWQKQYQSADAKLGESTSQYVLDHCIALSEKIDNYKDQVDERQVPCIAHGDLRCDNMIFDTENRVVALLDWELATSGHPVSDLSYLAMPYFIPPLPAGPMSGFAGLELKRHGLPSLETLIHEYTKSLNTDNETLRDVVDRALPHFELFAAVGYWRLASIVRGVYARAKAGNASAANAALVGSLASSLVNISRDLASRPPSQKFQRRNYSTRSSRSNVDELAKSVEAFIREEILPIEAELLEKSYSSSQEERWKPYPKLDQLKAKAKAAGLWNLFFLQKEEDSITSSPYQLANEQYPGGGLSRLIDYACICEITGMSLLAPEVFNCSAPDTGNMEVLAAFGTDAQKKQWLKPLLAGEIRSCFAMTEPAVASSDPTNLEASITDDGDDYLIINGTKHWTSGAMDPRCKIAIFMGKAQGSTVPSDAPPHRRHSMVLVPMELATVQRPLRVFGFDDAPHGHAQVLFDNIRIPKSEAMLYGHGRGFDIAQARLGPGRVHHCMRAIGACERALELTKHRIATRTAFGKPISHHGVFLLLQFY